MFVESFQRQYKDGTNGTRDFRMFSASFFILRILILVWFLNPHHLPAHSSEMEGAIFACATCIHAITKLYKLNFMINVDIVILFLLEILMFVTTTSASPMVTYLIPGTTLLFLIPHMTMIFHKLAKKTSITECLKRTYKTLKRLPKKVTRPTSEAESDVETKSDSPQDQLINLGEYEPVLPNTEKHPAAEFTENKEQVNKEPKKLISVYTYGSIN